MITTTITTLVATLVIILVGIVFPLLVIWALNTLFPVLAIPYTFDTWFATIILLSPFIDIINLDWNISVGS